MTEKFIWGWVVARWRHVLSYKNKSKASREMRRERWPLRAYFFPALPGWAKFVPRLRRWWFAGRPATRAWMTECSGRYGISNFKISNEKKKRTGAWCDTREGSKARGNFGRNRKSAHRCNELVSLRRPACDRRQSHQSAKTLAAIPAFSANPCNSEPLRDAQRDRCGES